MIKRCIFPLLLALLYLVPALAQTLPTPKEFFGFNIGDDYKLATYTQAEAYFKKLASLSKRVIIQEAGKTEEGRTQYLMIVSSPENLAKIAQYKEISQKMARAEGLTDEEAQKLSLEGKPVVWIDGGLHATEVVGAHQLIETYYQLLSMNDPETLRILDKVIILLSQVNPDGQELVSSWYMRPSDPLKRKMNIPKVYNKYIGHDNNRDFYMNNMKESTTISRLQYIDWMPEIIYNHHQSGPPGSILAGPPYRDPFNFNYDPMIITAIDGVAASMIHRLNVEDKPGYTRLEGSQFSTWWNGGLRTTPYFHNMVGILTEIVGNPTPMEIPLVPSRLIPDNATPYPVVPQSWHFRQAIDYSVSLNYGILDYASRHGDELLYNIYKMGVNSIKRGSEDHWTLEPAKVEEITADYNKEKKPAARNGGNRGEAISMGGGRENANIPKEIYDKIFTDPANRDARGYIIPADQADFPTAVKFINALIKSGILVQKASASFTVAGKSYPAGSFIVKTDQAFRPHVVDMFEPQHHPNDFAYPGGPPIRPYDAAGWTLAFQMAVKFDRVLDAFDGPFERVPYGELQNPPAFAIPAAKAGYLLDGRVNNAFIVANDVLEGGAMVYRTLKPEGGLPAGSFFIPSKGKGILEKSAAAFGLKPVPLSAVPASKKEITKARIAIFDQYGGSIPAGWGKWLMEQFHFAYTVIYPQDIDAGDLNQKFDVLLFIDNGIPAYGNAGFGNFGRGSGGRADDTDDIPAEYRHMLGRITPEKSIPQLKTFIQNGGNVITIGSSCSLAYHLGLPVSNALTQTTAEGREVPLPNDKYYIPGSILRVSVDTLSAADWGASSQTDVMFENSPVFKLAPDAISKGITPIMWFAEEKPLKSGWAWGQAYLKDGVAAFAAKVGKGQLYAFGPEVTFRGQAHGTFKFVFNELYK